jgi:cysteine desulfurase
MNIYFDNAATTKIATGTLDVMRQIEQDCFYNSSTLYSGGTAAKAVIDNARDIIREKLHGGKGDLIFMSGATEANNTVIFGKIKNTKHRLVTVSGEHSSVHSCAVYLQQQGFTADCVPLTEAGEIDINRAAELITDKTTLFVFGLVNSDVGTLRDAKNLIAAVRTKSKTVHIHCDAAQAFCKFDFDAELFDSVTVSAHKIHGPKGIAALWVKKGRTVPPLLHGGDHSRAGTEPTALIAGFASAVRAFDTENNFIKVSALHKRLVTSLPAQCKINGSNNNPYITNILLPDIYGETVLNALSEKGIFVGLGSACASSASGNRTLAAMGLTSAQQKQVLRVSLCGDNTDAEVDTFVRELRDIILKF